MQRGSNSEIFRQGPDFRIPVTTANTLPTRGKARMMRRSGNPRFMGLKAGEFTNIKVADLNGDEIAQGVGGIITTSPLLVDV